MADEYPEHAKMRAAKERDATQAVGEFFDFLTAEKGIQMRVRGMTEVECRRHLAFERDIERCDRCDDNGYVIAEGWVTIPPLHELLNEFFEIDGAALEAEKVAMLAAVREANRA